MADSVDFSNDLKTYLSESIFRLESLEALNFEADWGVDENGDEDKRFLARLRLFVPKIWQFQEHVYKDRNVHKVRKDSDKPLFVIELGTRTNVEIVQVYGRRFIDGRQRSSG